MAGTSPAMTRENDSRGARMTALSISEAGSGQFPMVRHAAEIGWRPLAPEVAKQKRGGEDRMLPRDELQ